MSHGGKEGCKLRGRGEVGGWNPPIFIVWPWEATEAMQMADVFTICITSRVIVVYGKKKLQKMSGHFTAPISKLLFWELN